ncbi:MAG: hypothetical protein H8K11_09700 [Nitrospira sp.]|nr:hypothetical protein [Nitrospira sp.]
MKHAFQGFDGKDAILVSLFAIVSGVVFYMMYGLHDETLVSSINDVWFQSDLKRVFENMTDRHARGHYRVKVHPLHSLFTFPPTLALRKLGVTPFKAVQIVTASIASGYVVAMFLLLRALGCIRFDAVVFSVLGSVSSAALFWLSVPECYALGATGIAVGLLLAALASEKKQAGWKYVAASAFSLSATVTNWMTGILSTFVGNHWKRTVVLTVLALSTVALLWGLEKHFFPNAVFFIGDREEGRYLFSPTFGRVVEVFNTFVFHTIVSPAVTMAGTTQTGWPLLSMQSSWPGSSGLLGQIGVIVWSPLLAIGIWAFFTLKTLAGLRIVLGLTVLGQLGLHLLYGSETFLYALHFLPLLVTVAALGTRSHLRIPALALALVLIPVAGMNNWWQFNAAIARAATPRHEVKTQMRLRPHDSWPRSTGHVLLASSGSREEQKAYHEPGGGFSPGVGTFGISVWLSSPDGREFITSENIPLNDMVQSFSWRDNEPLPGLRTVTPYYSTEWTQSDWGKWRLHLNLQDNVTLDPALLIRSAGPAGGPIHKMHWDGHALWINERWSVTIQPAPTAVNLGEEGASDWHRSGDADRKVISASGWAFARIQLERGTPWTINVHDAHPGLPPESAFERTSAQLNVDLPDPRFQQSLNAQAAHLIMGLVGRETRPGDPTNYPLAWQRDGAYVITALARSGRVETARILSKDLAERDFFGGFGPEADAPGLALWALSMVARQLRDQEFDRWLWPHMQRKVGLIEEMLTATSPIHKTVEGPIVPKHLGKPDLSLIAEPARDGLIIGKMDHHRPTLFINAISYRGLVEAAAMAHRLDHPEEERHWLKTAADLKSNWQKAFATPLTDNDRTYISALWPSWVAGEQRQTLADRAERRWQSRRDAIGNYKTAPLWTYFELAEAHQWLFLDHPDRAWSTMQWFWDHQSSPGFYTWWEGEGEENSFEKWVHIRGWVNPPHVTPHYWTAAEMALLQIDMLGYLDEGATEPVLVIGGGIPRSWLPTPMDVRGLRVGDIRLDWHWNGHNMVAVVHGESRVKVKLGASFPETADLRVTYQNT